MSAQLVFVVGTGRCGSTMVSRMLSKHPDVLSMSEFIGILRVAGNCGPNEFPVADMDGRELWRLLATPVPMLDAMAAYALCTPGARVDELVYPFGRGRFTPAAGVPMICHFALPLLASDPDALFDKLAAEVPSWPRRPAAAQYQALFGYLARVLGRPAVVERSGGALYLIGALREQFPSARFVHVYRDGPDCALSMSRHPMFRREILLMAAQRGTGLPVSATPERVDAALPARLRGMIGRPYDVARIMSQPIPAAAFGRDLWSPMICQGVAALGELPAGDWVSLRYEDLLRDPLTHLTALTAFIGVGASRPWLDAACRMVDPARAGAAARLDPAGFAALRAACEPGMRALRRFALRA